MTGLKSLLELGYVASCQNQNQPHGELIEILNIKGIQLNSVKETGVSLWDG